MLKALELTGFKSFADRTRFEFPAGITVVVGPNGSGKSNVVDAIKWVLGEQSAKSLRGKEMSDVIFKGAGGAEGRKPANSATATLILDNSERRFPHDSDEVLVSRRVYRSGEGEYLINNEACRLKDIRNMFRGTGIGTDAYSLIEQGKVDRLLQASAKERRAIFEEAAGISRFKAKKIEAQRRLARVDGNLVRLADIVEEVGSRYRSIKNQAAKAAKYREYSLRLQELRTHVGLKDWRSISAKLTEIEASGSEMNQRLANLESQVSESEQQSDSIEQRLDSFTNDVDALQQQASAFRESITRENSRIELNQTRLADLKVRQEEQQAQISRVRSRLEEVETRGAAVDGQLEQSRETVSQSRGSLEKFQQQLQQIDQSLDSVLAENGKARDDSSRLISLIGDLGRMVSAADSQIESLTGEKSRTESRIGELESLLQTRSAAKTAFAKQKQTLEADAESKNSDLAQARSDATAAQSDRRQREKRLAELKHSATAKTQRRKVLLELEKKLEGVNAGAIELLELAKKNRGGVYGEIVGVVADMITVNVQHAGIVDVALGSIAQYIVVDGENLLHRFADEKLQVKGRIGLIQLNDPPTLGADPDVSINGEPGVIGRADRLVQVKAPYSNFVRQLLGGTWIVRTLADALTINARKLGRIRLVTLDGEIVESDGTVIVGPKSAATGLVSRKSELRMLSREISELERTIESVGDEVKTARAAEAEADKQVQSLISENSNLARQLSDIAVRTEELDKQIAETSTALKDAKTGQDSAARSLAEIALKLTSNRENLTQSEARLEELNQIVAANESRSVQLRSERGTVEDELTTAKVASAKAEQQLTSLEQHRSQITAECEQSRSELDRIEQQQQSDQSARKLAQQEIDDATARVKSLEQELGTVQKSLESAAAEKAEIETKRRDTVKQLHDLRDELRSLQENLHQSELKSSQLQMERSRLADRLQEDYGIDIAKVSQQPQDQQELDEREAIDREISDLRKQIGSIGSVNMDALEELEELEQRYTKMDSQYQDLVAAKQSLENIIQRINSDSRRLFVETLDAIRSNFQSLFRQTFGGGKADIVLEEGVDPLEAGVEIVATPPGKPEFNNSLLSGGEKALTAVSLLMAIFQFRPSPFCVLDEVDAPFDEANIGRFIDVLKSFLGWTKFVIVTHSKKTMTAATTLYGVTMQESGVSKRVSVRFEDVGEDGTISADAVRRDQAESNVA